ncbi:RNA polymerase factor sigma-54 [Novosphingobium sp. JCM 18896]|uniref:RNA polymerase factor sigma-54 n=1 Tax=Novosphingobium sp. JCM 18896 TaxID=2989731 RepID=UPI0022225C82|nr:RNA polymerase factor sigma-54 [Novosphingobium sp. JCM 18896]MCW1431551.1 RNA polymerase factor sigma-54 [Novosphingobium sp. JCM 18896]
MALGPRLDLRQTQSLVMTPQLQQAIKLLALSNLEIETFIGEALEANPLLDLGEVAPPAAEAVEIPEEARRTSLESSPVDALIGEGRAADDRPLDIDPTTLDRDRDTGDFDSGDWGGDSRFTMGEEGPSIEERGGGEETLAEHLEAQIGTATDDPRSAAIARYLIGQLDDAGYLPVSLRDVAEDLGLALAEVEEGLALVQTLDPTGVGARSLGECIALQAQEADRYDPAMARLIDNLDLVARGDFARLKRICSVDDEDFADMLSELKGYDPKPGLRFGGGVGAPVTPDILITARADGGWDIALNQATLPRLIVNRSYYVELKGSCTDKPSKGWLSEKLADANWLIKALDQRQKTILKVAAEIVRQQDGFFRHGVSHLKPLTLRAVAETIGMHESTVSRVTSNKYLQCERGLFELKYFFTSGVAAADGEGAVSAQAVKAAIRSLIDAEDAKAILSDDALVDLLREKGFDLARRTVAKYREAIGLGSSVQRRRQKALAAVR